MVNLLIAVTVLSLKISWFFAVLSLKLSWALFKLMFPSKPKQKRKYVEPCKIRGKRVECRVVFKQQSNKGYIGYAKHNKKYTQVTLGKNGVWS